MTNKALIDYVLLPKQMHGSLLDVNVCTGESGRLSESV